MSKITRIVTAAASLGVMGLAVLPVSGYASNTVTVDVTITSGISVACDKNYTHTYAPSNAADSTGDASEASNGTCVVSGNASNYTLTLADSDTNTSLNDGGSNSIPSIASNSATAPQAGTPGWAVRIGAKGAATAGGQFLKIPASNASSSDKITVGTGGATAGDSYKYAFSTAISANLAATTYEGEVTFTLTTS
jgi:hypothetical protein